MDKTVIYVWGIETREDSSNVGQDSRPIDNYKFEPHVSYGVPDIAHGIMIPEKDAITLSNLHQKIETLKENGDSGHNIFTDAYREILDIGHSDAPEIELDMVNQTEYQTGQILNVPYRPNF